MEEVLDYERLVYSIIQKYSNRFDKEDLYQVGMIGLMDAYKHYNKNYDTKFSTYAYYYILGEVNKYIRENAGIKVSKKLIDLKVKILKAKEAMEQNLGREVTNLEISIYLDIDIELINNALLATQKINSLDEINNTKSYNEVSIREDILDLKSEIEKLNDDEKKIIIERYYNELTQSEASNKLGISQVQVSRGEAKILKKLKTRL